MAARIAGGDDEISEAQNDGGQISAARIGPGSGGPVVVAAPSGLPQSRGLSATVPEGVLQQAGGTVIAVLSEHGPDAKMELATPGAALAEAPVAFRLFNAEGEPLDSSALAEPIHISLGPDKRIATCAFWNNTIGAWSSVGLSEVEHDGPELICATIHLTLFAAILQVFVDVVACSNVVALSAESFERLADGGWAGRPGCLILWSMMVLSVIAGAVAKYFDTLHRRNFQWSEDMLLTGHEAFDNTKHHASRDLFHEIVLAKKFAQAPSKIGDFFVDRCARHVAAHDKGIIAIDVKQLMMIHQVDIKNEKIAKKRTEVGGTSSEGATQSTVTAGGKCLHRDSTRGAEVRMEHSLALQQAAQKGIEEFSKSWRPAWKVWVLFSSLHPWLQLRFFSLGAYGAERALLPAARLFLTMFSCALFFERSLNDTGEGDDCEAQNWQEEFARNIAVAVLGSMLSKLPLLMVKKLQRRRFKHSDNWDAQARRKQMLKWMLADVVQWLLGLLYIGFSTLFILSFIANINRATEMQFLSSAVAVLAKQFFFSPLIQAVFFASAGTAMLEAKDAEEKMKHIATSLHYVVDEIEEEATEVEEKLEQRLSSTKSTATVAGVSVQIRVEGIDETQVTDASWHVLEASLVAQVAQLAQVSEQSVLAPDGHIKSLHINGHCHSRSLFSQLQSLVAKPAPHSNGHLVTLVDAVLDQSSAEPDLRGLRSADSPRILADAIRKALGEECLGERTLLVKVTAEPPSTARSASTKAITKAGSSDEHSQQADRSLGDATAAETPEVPAPRSYCCTALGICNGREPDPGAGAPPSGSVFALCMRRSPDAADVVNADPIVYS